jgi:glutathione reductase (NADPH)
MEFAYVARAAGAEVTVLETHEQILVHFEPELVDKLRQAAENEGIGIITGYKVCEVKKHDGSFVVTGDENCEVSYEGNLVVHGAGRTAALEALALDAGGVAYSPQGVQVNDYLQSISNGRVYAIGDMLAKSVQLSPVADMESRVAADNILNGNRTKPDYTNIPSIVFTNPPLAGVGMTEKEAESAGLQYRINKGSMTSWPSSLRIGQKQAFYKVIMEKGSGRFLGVHILGHNAGEIINVFALAMKFGHTGKDLQKVLWAYPTSISDLQYMIE